MKLKDIFSKILDYPKTVSVITVAAAFPLATLYGHPFESEDDKTLRATVNILSSRIDGAEDSLSRYNAAWERLTPEDKGVACKILSGEFRSVINVLEVVRGRRFDLSVDTPPSITETLQLLPFLRALGRIENLGGDIVGRCLG